MILGALLAGVALSGGAPDHLRRDGAVVLGCTSMQAVQSISHELPTAGPVRMVSGALAAVAAPEEPLWVVATPNNVPLQVSFSLRDGQDPPGMLRLMPGSPRFERVGDRLDITLGPPPRETPGGARLLSLLQHVDVDRGCVAATLRPATFAVGLAADGGLRVALPLPQAPVSSDRPFEAGLWALARVLESPASPARARWAASEQTPDLSFRLNAPVRASDLEGLLDADSRNALAKVRVEPGGEVGVWGGRGHGIEGWGAVLPIAKPRTVRWWPGRIAKRAAQNGGQVERRGRVYRVPFRQREVWITSTRRRLIVASSHALAQELRDRRVGTPWLSGSDHAPVDAPGAVLSTGLAGGRTEGVLIREGDVLGLTGRRQLRGSEAE